MAITEYSLFRAKMIPPAQASFLHDNLSSREIFEAALKERPSSEINVGRTWHIGNVEQTGRETGRFAFGRTSRLTNTKFDEATGDFIEEDFDTSPYAQVVYNARIGFVGIAHNYRLASSATGIARKLEIVFSHALIVKENDFKVLISPISDPRGFLKSISTAFRVNRFTAHFTGPNPLDADELFQAPLSVYAKISNASKGKAQIDGDELNKEVVAEVARSTAASGNKASARIRRTEKQAPITIRMEEGPVKRGFDEAKQSPLDIVSELTNAYNEVRANE